MGSSIEKLVEISSEQLVGGEPSNRLPGALLDLLKRKNGFVGFYSALHVLPSADQYCNVMTVERWNAPDGWRRSATGLEAGWICFAQDLFAVQFAVDPAGQVWSYDPEINEAVHLATDLDAWASMVLDDSEYLTGWVVARDWQISNGVLSPDTRLLPRIPAVLGGHLVADNLQAEPMPTCVSKRMQVAELIHDRPDGESVSFHGYRD